jgi:hypothetical protein
VLDRWGRRALEIAAEVRAARPRESKAGIAREIRKRADAGEAALKLPVENKPIAEFLSENGF